MLDNEDFFNLLMDGRTLFELKYVQQYYNDVYTFNLKYHGTESELTIDAKNKLDITVKCIKLTRKRIINDILT